MSFLPELKDVVNTAHVIAPFATHLFGGEPGRPISLPNASGAVYENASGTWCLLTQVAAPNPAASRGEQTTRIFETIEQALQAEGMGFGNVLRTWFYLDGILDWYGEFNQARTAFFQSRGTFGGLLPASTGIGIANQLGAPVVTGVLAVKGSAGFHACEVPSPLQGSACDYKSSFSRAVEFAGPGFRQVCVSGTASIAADGRSLHLGDMRAQVEETMRVAEALLQSRGMGWQDCNRAVAYIKRAEDAPVFAEYLRHRGLTGLPLTWMHADVCREELLFEIELDARVNE
ncbi:MAG: hypothetical protein ACFUZC_09545 [Chthoniobacteraceae bacterium]